ncbi:radical SAM protein [Candidatus Sumerlaeota bacterium]|nr:radical SAM protein [Candidatus Sumerlaeota bacterium]
MKPEQSFRRILFLNPPSGLYRRDDRCQSRVEDQTVRIVFPPIDLARLAAIARRAGAEARIGDYPALGASWDRYRADLAEFRPDAVAFSVTTATVGSDIEAARIARAVDPAIRTVALGQHFEDAGETLLRSEPALDLALHGEVEENFERLVRGESPANWAAVLYRNPESGEIVRRPGPAIVEDLDSLPFPARDLLDNSLYRSPETGNPLTTIQANRGCPARCVFCPAGRLSDYRLRLRSPVRILEEIRQCVEAFGLREFLFNGDTFTMNKRWLLELCAAISDSGLGIRWGCNSRVDTMDRERAEALRRAGCWVVAFGVESGDQEMLDRMKKGTRLEQAERAVEACKAAGLATHAFFVIGLPWETKETLDRTMALARRLDTDFFDINIAYPLPGTEFYEIARREGLIERLKETHGKTGEGASLPDGSYARAAVRTHTLSADYLTRWRRNALLRLYARPRYVARTLRRAARTGTVRNYLRAAATRVRGLLSS